MANRFFNLIIALFVGLIAIAVPTTAQTSTDPLGNVWVRANFGAAEANWYIDQMARDVDGSMVKYAIDHYYTNVPSGTQNRWGDGWLSEYVVWMLGIRAWELRDKLSDDQKNELDVLIADSFNENVFRIDSTCGVDPWNTCSEDFSGNSLKYSLGVLYKRAAEMAGGQTLVAQLMEKYRRLAYSEVNGYYSLVREVSPIDGLIHTVIHNHGDQSAVYANVLGMNEGNVTYTYALAGMLPPNDLDSGTAESMLELYQWMQLTALPDGSAFLPNGCTNHRGENAPCNDPTVANTVPTFVPGGRGFVTYLGTKTIVPGAWPFLQGDPSCNTGNSWNAGRKLTYHVYNPMPLDIISSTSVSGPSVLIIWNLQTDAISYDVMSSGGLLGNTKGTSYKFLNVPVGTFQYGVVPRGGELNRILGVNFGSVEVPRLVRRHLTSTGGASASRRVIADTR